VSTRHPRRSILTLPLVLLCWSALAPADPPAGWTFHPYDEALRLAQQDQRRVFLYFGRHGCPSCEKTNRESFSDPRVFDRYNANYVLAYVDAESGERLRLPGGERITEMELGMRLRVIGTPSFYFLEPDGEPISRSPGYQSADELLLLDRYVSGDHFRHQTFADFRAAES
jgi:thioredoxin-related protein